MRNHFLRAAAGLPGVVGFPPWEGPFDGDAFLAALDAETDQAFAQSTATFGNLSGSLKWFGGVLAPNGKIYGIPASATTVLEIDPVAQSTATFGNLSGSLKWYGGVLAPNGKIYGIPRDSTTILEIDPVAQTTATFGSLAGTSKWTGGVLAPNGKIYGIPRDSTTVLAIGDGGLALPDDMTLSAYLNKL